MNSQPILGCALNLSEGRRPEVIGLIVETVPVGVLVLDVSSDPDHNRTVLTLCGNPPDLVDAVVGLAATAIANIDLRQHRGAHPRLGAVDVVPFYPVRGASMADAVAAARACASRLWSELSLPAFLYEEAAARPEARTLPSIRRLAFNGLAPDFGGPGPNPAGGATVVGARGLLVAYNVDLETQDVVAARTIASAMRLRYPGAVRALGLHLPSRATAQVSMNLLTPTKTCLEDVFNAVQSLAAESGIAVRASEIVGLIPRACLCSADEGALKIRDKPKILEDLVDRLFAG
jgi:glutamate formiminotransferase